MKISAALAKELSGLPERATVMVVGEVDTGKSTLVALLARWFLSTGRKAAIVDADIGQADIGPPGFVSYGFPEQDFDSLKAVTRRASYMAGNTSPYGRGLNVAAGVQACVRDAKREGADVIVIDTSGLVRGVAGRQLKCAKAETVRPDLIVILSTPGVETLAGHLEHLGFHVRRFLPIPGARAKAAEERKNSRISRWNSYLGSNLRLIAVDLSRVKVCPWWGETRHVDTEYVPHGTVAAIQDPRRPGFHIPCVWMVAGQTGAELQPSILVPQDVEGEPVDVADGGPADGGPELVWVSGYKLGLEGTRVVSA